MDFSFNDDTICAIATPVGEGGIGIVKISGPHALPIALRLFKPHQSLHSLQSHRLTYGWIIDAASQEPIDEVLLAYMAAPNTYTREDVVEINCHSGFMVLNRILEKVLSEGARLAEPGEFTRRAFLSGRIDLSQAEAVFEIIHSRSQQGLMIANRLLRGEFRARVEAWREDLLQLQTQIEACIDFTEDVDDDLLELSVLTHRLEEHFIGPIRDILSHYQDARILREGLTLVLIGKPNVGKSSLLNVLLRKDRAIVTPFPGTTRDVIEDSFFLSGVEVRVLDTAGIRTEPDAIESLGIQRTLNSVREADVVLWLIDRSRPLGPEDDLVFQSIGESRHVILLNKSDLPAAVSEEEVRGRYHSAARILQVSVFSASDMEGLRDFMSQSFLRRPLELSRSAILPNLRHKEHFAGALEALGRAASLLRSAGYPELVSLEFQMARKELDAVLGCGTGEDVLERIFSQFCIGK